MNIPCDKRSLCLDQSNPVVNLSSEAPDSNVFFGRSSGPGSNNGTASGPGSGWRPGDRFNPSCNDSLGPNFCAEPTQQLADLCAENLGITCNPPPGAPPIPPGTPPQGPNGRPMFYNAATACTVRCPDGNPFTFLVAAGLFPATSQILADRQAESYACQLAEVNKVCMGNLSSTHACAETIFNTHLTVSGRGPFTFSVVAGALPPGTTITGSGNVATISGTPTTGGSFNFTLRAVSPTGLNMQKSYTIAVIGITSGALPDFTTGNPYTYQFTVIGGNSPYTFDVVNGALPDGLSLSTAGMISGTATSSANADLTVGITDSTGSLCFFDRTIKNGTPVGFRICNWNQVLTLISAPSGVCDASGLPAWDGIFNKQSTFLNGAVQDPLIYFIGQSAGGKKVSADESGPEYPNGDWQDDQSFYKLQYFSDSEFWILSLVCTNGANTWIGLLNKTDPLDPSGIYNFNFGDAAGVPATIEVCKTTLDCAPDWTTLNWTVGPLISTPDGVMTAAFAGNGGNTVADGQASFPSTGDSFISGGAVGTLNYTGCACNCQINLNVTDWAFGGGLSHPGVSFSIKQNSLIILNYNSPNVGFPGTATIPFVVNSGTNSTIEITVSTFAAGHTPQNRISEAFTITNPPPA